jgi:dipeptidyl aminopeptidase/acylaminoacyl peptidase
LTQNGIAVASLNYRFTDETRFPGQLTDCENAIDYLTREAQERGFEFGPITACGLSAGGHLSLMLAGTGAVDNAIAFGAPVDLTPEEAREGYRETLERFVGTPLHLEKLKAASPVHNLAKSSARYILVHGTEDRTVPYQQALQMTNAIAQANLNVELVLVPRGSHTVVGGPVIWDRIVTLLAARL